MEITIHDKNAFNSSLEKTALLWQVRFKKLLKNIIIQISIGIILVIAGLFSDNGEKEPWIISGAVYILLTLLSFIQVGKQKSKFFADARKSATIYYRDSNDLSITIYDEGVIFWCSLFKTDIKWKALYSFTVYKNYLFINTTDTLFSSISIDKKLLTENEFSELLNFIRLKLPEKKQL